jgi:hypothetical protein
LFLPGAVLSSFFNAPYLRILFENHHWVFNKSSDKVRVHGLEFSIQYYGELVHCISAASLGRMYQHKFCVVASAPREQPTRDLELSARMTTLCRLPKAFQGSIVVSWNTKMAVLMNSPELI